MVNYRRRSLFGFTDYPTLRLVRYAPTLRLVRYDPTLRLVRYDPTLRLVPTKTIRFLSQAALLLMFQW